MTVHRSTTASCFPALLKAAALRSKHERGAFGFFFGFCFFIAVTKRGFYSRDPVQSGDPTAADVTGLYRCAAQTVFTLSDSYGGPFRRGLRSCQKSISSRKTAFGVTFVSFRNGLSVGRQLIWKEAPGRVVRRQIATSGLTEPISALSPPLRCHLCLPLLFFFFFFVRHKNCSRAALHTPTGGQTELIGCSNKYARTRFFFFFHSHLQLFVQTAEKRRAVTNN